MGLEHLRWSLIFHMASHHSVVSPKCLRSQAAGFQKDEASVYKLLLALCLPVSHWPNQITRINMGRNCTKL